MKIFLYMIQNEKKIVHINIIALFVKLYSCSVGGIQTCLPKAEVCLYSPESCQDFQAECEEKTWEDKLGDCFSKLWAQEPDNTARLCATNTRTIEDLKDQPDEQLFVNFWFFKHLSYNVSICQDQVSARLISCRRDCVEHDTDNLAWQTCSTGRCITDLSLCDGYSDCPAEREDESFEKCSYYWSQPDESDGEDFGEEEYGEEEYVEEELEAAPDNRWVVPVEDYIEGYFLCAIDNSNMPHFPCFKSGACIPPSLVSVSYAYGYSPVQCRFVMEQLTVQMVKMKTLQIGWTWMTDSTQTSM